MKRGNMYGSGDKGRATRLHSLIVRARGACERCGSTEGLQCAHIVSRRYAATRTDLDNAWCLCARDHWALTADPFAHVTFAIQTRGEDGYAALRNKALAGIQGSSRLFWQAEVARLRAVASEWGVAA